MTSIALNPIEPLHLVAIDRPQLEAAHAKMLEWVSARLDKIEVDVDVESTALDLAQRNGWVTAPFTRRLNTLGRQRTFYTKIKAAVEAGFAIVPNFPMDIFAIRTNAEKPKDRVEQGKYSAFRQDARMLAPGEGRYVNPMAGTRQKMESETRGGKEVVTCYSIAGDEFNDVEFPIALAKPELMSRVGHAMAMKLFDEIGVADDRSGDPILLGRIKNPVSSRPAISFFLGWHFDPSRL